jgi:hypothetical protein
MLPFAEHKKQVLTCVPCVEQREHVLNMFNTREHRAAQRNSTKQPTTPLHCFSTTYPQCFSTDKKTEATTKAASVRKIRLDYLRSISKGNRKSESVRSEQ